MPGWIALHVVIGVAGTWLARRYALQRNLLDHPGERRSHAVATPRGGGVAIVAALLVAAVALALRDPSQRPLLLAFAIGLVLVAAVGLVDDHRPLAAPTRLFVHAVAAAVFAGTLLAVTGDIGLAALAFVAAVSLTNIWNFMDGINGIAASQAMVAGLALWLGQGGAWGSLALALASACLGFLPYNFPRARIFMGDAGSGAIGFSVAVLGATLATRAGAQAAWLLLPLAPFLVDAGLTLSRRMLRGERWWTAHAQHAYQVWARRAGHARVTLCYGAYSVLGIGMAFAWRERTAFFMLCVLAAWYTSAALVWGRIQAMESGGASPMNKDSR